MTIIMRMVSKDFKAAELPSPNFEILVLLWLEKGYIKAIAVLPGPATVACVLISLSI